MGYQESFIYTSTMNLKANRANIEQILQIFQKHNLRCASDMFAECVCRLHFNENVPPFRKGMEMLVICGDREVQRGYRGLFSLNRFDENAPRFSTAELKVIKKVKILFIEEAMQICAAEETSKITVEKLNLQYSY